MKLIKWMILASLVTLVYACQEEAITPVEFSAAVAERKAAEPAFQVYHLKIRSDSIEYDLLSTPMCGIPSSGWITGHISHLGRLERDASTWTIVACSFDFSDPADPKMISEVEGQWAAANRDKLIYEGTLIVHLVPDPAAGFVPVSFESSGNVVDGTGRFMDATGTYEEASLSSGGSVGTGVIYVPK